MQRHDEFESLIQQEKDKQKLVRRVFNLADILIVTGFTVSIGLRYQLIILDSKTDNLVIEESILEPIVLSTLGVILAWCAYYLTRMNKTLRGKKPNTCLLVWHIVNVFIGVVSWLVVFYTRQSLKKIQDYGTYCEQLDYTKAQLFSNLSIIFLEYYYSYLTLFILWLLYRFTNTRQLYNSLVNKQAEQQIGNTLINTEDQERFHNKTIFLEYIDKEMHDPILTESSISNEFIALH